MNGKSVNGLSTGVLMINRKVNAIRILRGCSNFQDDNTQMVYILSLLTVRLEFAPKCYPEIAVRGIEYAFGYPKLRFGINLNDALPNNQKTNVPKSLDQEVITINRMWKYARKAHEYKLTYSLISDMNDGETASTGKDGIEHITKVFIALSSGCMPTISSLLNHEGDKNNELSYIHSIVLKIIGQNSVHLQLNAYLELC